MVGDEVGADFRAAGANLAGAIEHILVRQRHAMERRERMSGFDGSIGRAGLLARRLGGYPDETVERRLPSFDAVETGFDQRLGV